MKKLASLRNYLLNAGLEHKLEPENVTTMTRGGKIISHYRRPGEGANQPHNKKFQFKYTAQLLVMDYSGEVGDLFYLLTTWLDDNLPNHKPDTIKVDIEQLNHRAADVLIEIEDLIETYNPRELSAGIKIGSCGEQLVDEIVGVWDEQASIIDNQNDAGPYA